MVCYQIIYLSHLNNTVNLPFLLGCINDANVSMNSILIKIIQIAGVPNDVTMPDELTMIWVHLCGVCIGITNYN